jgi:hypothetical protein
MQSSKNKSLLRYASYNGAKDTDMHLIVDLAGIRHFRTKLVSEIALATLLVTYAVHSRQTTVYNIVLLWDCAC